MNTPKAAICALVTITVTFIALHGLIYGNNVALAVGVLAQMGMCVIVVSEWDDDDD